MIKREFTKEQAEVIGKRIGVDFTVVNIEEFIAGLLVELEHGSHDLETNVTDNDEDATGKIAWAHLKEIPDYYTRLTAMEKEAEDIKE